MKKFIALLLVSIISMSLVACGGGSESAKDEKTAAATTLETGSALTIDKDHAIAITMEELNETVNHNQAKAAQYIDDKTYEITGYAAEIYTDYLVLFAEENDKTTVKHYEKEIDKQLEWEFVVYAYMPIDELAKVNKNDRITVYGLFTEVALDDMGDMVDRTYLKLENAQIK